MRSVGFYRGKEEKTNKRAQKQPSTKTTEVTSEVQESSPVFEESVVID
jgi:hypothetical protein